MLASCNHDDQTPQVAGQFSFSFTPQTGNAGRIMAASEPAFISYTIKDANNQVSNGKVAIYKFGAFYVSNAQAINTGNYELQEYFVLNANNEIMFAAVKEGTAYASLVHHTLPMQFQVNAGETTEVNPNVLPVTSNSSPESFGYAKWTYNQVGRLVTVALPVRPELSEKISAINVVLSTGNFSSATSMGSSFSSDNQLYTTVLVKVNELVKVSIKVDAYNVYSSGYPKMDDETDVSSRTSHSQLEYKHTFTDLAQDTLNIPVFNHKIGNDWNFNFAEITTNGNNGSWITMRYEGGDFCNQHVTLTTNASAISSESATDKLLWSQPLVYKNDSGVIVVYDFDNEIAGASSVFGPPSCSNNVCTFVADLGEDSRYSAFADACGTSAWVSFDALTYVKTVYNGQLNGLPSYFSIEKNADNAWPARIAAPQSSNGPRLLY